MGLQSAALFEKSCMHVESYTCQKFQTKYSYIYYYIFINIFMSSFNGDCNTTTYKHPSGISLETARALLRVRKFAFQSRTLRPRFKLMARFVTGDLAKNEARRLFKVPACGIADSEKNKRVYVFFFFPPAPFQPQEGPKWSKVQGCFTGQPPGTD